MTGASGSAGPPGADIRGRVRQIALPIALGLGRLGLTPNAITVLGFLGTCVAAALAAAAAWLPAGVLVLVFGAFDMLDGALARATGRASAFGAFFDSTLDRTGESLVYAGIAAGAAAAGFNLGVILACLALTFASSVTYARARAESLGLHGQVGVAPREIRLVLLFAGLVLAGIPGGFLGFSQAWLGLALLIIAALSAITIGQRLFHVHQQLAQSTNPQ